MAESFQKALNRANPQTIADALRIIAFGNVLRALVTALRQSATAASPYIAATAAAVSKQAAADAPAARITSAYARAGGVTGPLTVVATNPPASGEISVAPNGMLQVLAADAITSLDVQYEPQVGEVWEGTLPVVANSAALPSFITDRGAATLLESEALVGTVTGKKIIDAPGTAPAAAHSALNTAKTAVAFQATDAVTSARVKLFIGPVTDLTTLLSSDSPVLLPPPAAPAASSREEENPMSEQAPASPAAAPAGTPAGPGGTTPPAGAQPSPSVPRGTATGEPIAPPAKPATPAAPAAPPAGGAPRPAPAKPATPGEQPQRFTLTQEQIKERVQQGQRAALKDIFGTDNADEIRGKLARLQELEENAEAARRATLDKEQRLTEDLEKANQRIAEMQQQLSEVDEQKVVQQQQTTVQAAARRYINPDLLDEATYLFARHVRSLDERQVAAMDEKAIAAWFKAFATKKPAFAAKPAAAPQAPEQRRPGGAPTPAPRPKAPAAPAAPAGGAGTGKTMRPGQPNSMSPSEARAEAAKLGIRW